MYNIRKWLVFCTCFAMFCQSDQFKLNQPNPDQSRPIQTTPDQSRPIKTNQDQSRPIQTNPDQSRPIQTNPDLSRPIQNYPDQSRPIQTNTCLSSKTWKVVSNGLLDKAHSNAIWNGPFCGLLFQNYQLLQSKVKVAVNCCSLHKHFPGLDYKSHLEFLFFVQ